MDGGAITGRNRGGGPRGGPDHGAGGGGVGTAGVLSLCSTPSWRRSGRRGATHEAIVAPPGALVEPLKAVMAPRKPVATPRRAAARGCRGVARHRSKPAADPPPPGPPSRCPQSCRRPTACLTRGCRHLIGGGRAGRGTGRGGNGWGAAAAVTARGLASSCRMARASQVARAVVLAALATTIVTVTLGPPCEQAHSPRSGGGSRESSSPQARVEEDIMAPLPSAARPKAVMPPRGSTYATCWLLLRPRGHRGAARVVAQSRPLWRHTRPTAAAVADAAEKGVTEAATDKVVARCHRSAVRGAREAS